MEPALPRGLAVGFILAFLAPREVAGMGAVVGPSGQTISIANTRMAVAASPGRTLRWAQIRVTSASTGFGWLVPVLPGARVDLASDAWLDALDAATVPVVKPPKTDPSCAASLEPEVLAPMTSPSSRAPYDAVVALDADSLSSFVSRSGFDLPGGLASDLGEVFALGGAVLALVYGAGSLPVRTLRVIDDGPATLPFSLSGSPAGDVAVTAFAVAKESRQAGSSPLTVDAKALRWSLDGTSTYDTSTSSLLAGAGDLAWITQSSEPGPFFQRTTIDHALSLPSAIDDYYRLASAYGDTSADPAACSSVAETAESGSAPFAAACPSGALAVVPGASPCSASSPDSTPITALVCGGAVDAALAVGNLPPASVWITRVEGIVTASTAADVTLLAAGTSRVPVVLTAGGYSVDCSPGTLPGSGAPEGGGWGDEGRYGEGGSSGAGSASSWGDGGISSPTGDVGAASDGCGSDTTTTSDPSSDDTSSDGCGSDPSSDDGSSGCSGDSSSDDAGGCSGSSPSDGMSDCSTTRHRHRAKSPLSRGVLVSAFVLGLVRRLRQPGVRATK
jgi:hypothetical protein